MQHTPGAAQRLHPPCPPGPHAEPGGGFAALQPRARPREGAAPPPPPAAPRGYARAGGGGGAAAGCFAPGGCFALGVVDRSRFCCAFFFFPSRCFVPSCSRFAARGRVVLRSGFRFALRFALLPAFHFAHLLFVSFRAPFPPPRTPSYFVRLFLHTLPIGPPFSLRSPWVCTPFSLRTPFPHPPLARTPLLPTPHPTATPNSGRTPSPHPKPPSTPHSGAQRGAGEERRAHGGPRAISGQLAGSAHHYRERRCGAGGGPPRVPARCPYKPGR